MRKLQKVVVVGAKGLGSDVVRLLASKDPSTPTQVVITKTKLAEAQATAAELSGPGLQVTGCEVNVTDLASVKAGVACAVQTLGTIDAVFILAGGNLPKASVLDPDGPWDKDETLEAMRECVEINLTGTIFTALCFAEAVRRQTAPCSIITCGSMTGDRPWTKVVSYGASKAGVANFTQALAVLTGQLAPHIVVNCGAPGLVETDQNRPLLRNPDGTPKPRLNDIERMIPTGKTQNSEQCARVLIAVAMFDDTDGLRGQTFFIDDGMHASSGISPKPKP